MSEANFTSSKRIGIFAAVAIVAIAFAALFDRAVAQWAHDSGAAQFLTSHKLLREGLKAPGFYPYTIMLGVIVGLLHRANWRAGLFLIIATATSALNQPIKYIAGRKRPFKLESMPDQLAPFTLHPFAGWKNLCFPSGHATLAFATAAALAILWPRARWAFFALAGAVAIERFVETAHWLSDCVAARLGNRWSLVRRKIASFMDDTIPHLSPRLSLVIPAYNEQENIPTLLQRVEESLSKIGKPYEVILIDDGSTDETPKLLRDAMQSRPWLRVITMRKNAGQSAAFEAGFEAARGTYIATIDADLQNDPEELPRLLAMIEKENVDLISGWRKERQDTAFRRWQSRQANRIRNWITQETVNDSASSLKIYRAGAIKGIKLFRGAHRYFPTLIKMRGGTVIETPVKHSARFAGTAKYGFGNRAFVGIADLFGVRWMKKRFLRYQCDEVKRDSN